MVIRIRKDLADKIGQPVLAKFGVQDRYGIRDHVDLSLATLGPTKLTELEGVLKAAGGKMATLLIQDIGIWRKATTSDPGPLKSRTVQGFHGLLERYLLQFDGHRLMHQHDDTWLSSYVNRVTFNPPTERGHDRTPPSITIQLLAMEYGKLDTETVTIREDDIRGRSVSDVLAKVGFFPESPERRAAYLGETKRWEDVATHIGRQYLCTGLADDSPDGNPTSEHGDRRQYWSSDHDIEMVRNGEPTRVVADVFFEAEGTSRRRGRRHQADNEQVDGLYWIKVAEGTSTDDDDDAPTEHSAIADDAIEIPVHPFLVVFDLSKHLRLRVHVAQLTDYRYDKQLADRLILSQERKTLVQMLIDMHGQMFRDIVKGKGGGSVVLLAGAPGTGKTLTAEVYAESEGRALYSVQCSQLGIDPDTLEDALLKTFDRARRWNAVMLLDEADVYVRERGGDMVQNAVVGVFLRVLEYQQSVLFLTTNRPDDVDDAIASRCIAKLTYMVPDLDEQARIWRVLADGAGITISDGTIQKIVKEHPNLSGRDVKNLLKLGSLMGGGTKEITADAVRFCKSFKPTKDVG